MVSNNESVLCGLQDSWNDQVTTEVQNTVLDSYIHSLGKKGGGGGGDKIKIQKGDHMIELWQTFQRQVLWQNVFITRDECRLLIKVPLPQETEVCCYLGIVIVSLPVS